MQRNKNTISFGKEKKGAISLMKQFVCGNACLLSGLVLMQVCDLLFPWVVAVYVPPTLPGGCRWHGVLEAVA